MKPKPFPMPNPDQIKRFWSHVEKTDTCWIWTGARSRSHGFEYGAWKYRGFLIVRAHRMAYFLHHGKIDWKLTIDHLCENKLCCNPAHMEQVTQSENSKRAFRRHPERLVTQEQKREKNRKAQLRWRERNPERAKEQAKRSYQKVGKFRRFATYAKWKAMMDAWYPKETGDQGYCETLRAETDITDLLS